MCDVFKAKDPTKVGTLNTWFRRGGCYA